MVKKAKKVSVRYTKRYFNIVGLYLIAYVLFALFIPYALHTYMQSVSSDILNDDFLYYGIYLILMLFGTLIPFFLMRLSFKIPFKKLNRSAKASFIDLFVQTIVVFVVCIALIFISGILLSYIGIESKLLASIGFSFDDVNLSNPLYVFCLVFVSPLIEEYAFRGVLLNTLSKFGKRFAYFASAIIFALAHFNLSEIIPALAMGLLLGKTSLKYKSIHPTIFIHILFNGLLYMLCVIPDSITRYISYGLVLIVMIAGYLIVSGKYEFIQVQKQKSDRLISILFYARPTIVITMILMIIHTFIYMYL